MSRFTLDLKRGSFLMVLFLLVGCGHLQQIEFDKTANSHINKIALLRVDEPEEIDIRGSAISRPCVCLGGCLGAGLSVGTDRLYTKKYRQEFNDHHIQFGPTVVEAFRQNLTKKGYKFIYLQDQLPMLGGHDKTDYYSQIDTDADAILSFWIWGVKYSSHGLTADYRPSVCVFSRLFDTRSKREIYSRIFAMGRGYVPTNAERINIESMSPFEKYKYNTLDTLMKNIDEAAQGISDCLNYIAARIAEQLK